MYTRRMRTPEFLKESIHEPTNQDMLRLAMFLSEGAEQGRQAGTGICYASSYYSGRCVLFEPPTFTNK